jgi:hypothetical protein
MIWEDQLSTRSRYTGAGSPMDGCRFAMRAIAMACTTNMHSEASSLPGTKGPLNTGGRTALRKGNRRTA